MSYGRPSSVSGVYGLAPASVCLGSQIELTGPEDDIELLGTGKVTGSNDAETASDVAQRVQEALTSTFELQDIALHVGVSIGVVPITAATDDVASLLSAADSACAAAKDAGRNRVEVVEAA